MQDRNWQIHKDDSGNLILRASKLGSCIRAQVMELRGFEKVDHPPESKLIFDMGRVLEPVIIKHAGYDLDTWWNKDEVESRWEILPGIFVEGHPDGQGMDGLFSVVLESKSMNPFQFSRMKKEDIAKSHPQYMIQGLSYIKGMNADIIRYLTLDKGDARPRIHTTEFTSLDMEQFLPEAIRRAEIVLKYAMTDNKRLPGKEKNLPRWACMKRYCQFHQCRFNEVQTAAGIAIWKAKQKKEKLRGSKPVQTSIER